MPAAPRGRSVRAAGGAHRGAELGGCFEPRWLSRCGGTPRGPGKARRIGSESCPRSEAIPLGSEIWERMFVTADGHPGARLRRALENRNLTAAEQAAFDVPYVPLAEARELVELYAEKGDPKYERAALKYLVRYMTEASPSLMDVAQLAALLAERGLLMRGL